MTTSVAAARPPTAAPLLALPHHDGSDAYVVERPQAVGDRAVVRLRVPHASALDAVFLRYVVDGEPRSVEAEPDAEREHETWWRAELSVDAPAVGYRWVLKDGGGTVSWLNGLGHVGHDVPDADDFVIGVDAGGPDWHLRSVVYEIFPDRFASTGASREAPDWAIRRAWDELPTGRGPATPHEWFGGDLGGVEARLDHVARLGANVLYLTPFFPAGSTHRYDATSFEHVDPLLGGDEALRSLVAAAHARGIRVIGDLTTNHTGSGHEWFVAARADVDAPERGLYLFDERVPNGYHSWIGVASLPKLNWRSEELRARMEAVTRRWLEPPVELDGWRVDVANMTGRLGAVDVNRSAAETLRHAAQGARSDVLLVAEHGHDFRGDVWPGAWHGTMNYSGFLRPAWFWLQPGTLETDPFSAAPAPVYDGGEAVATMRAFRAGVAWPSTLHSWTLLGSHDTPRVATVTGSRERQLVALGLSMTTPGVPMVFAGDELGLHGDWGEDARRTMPWDTRERWDTALLDGYRRLIAIRRSSEALATGGLRYAWVDGDVIAYLRETASERLLCVASRAPHAPLRLPLDVLACRELEPLLGPEAEIEAGGALVPADGPAFGIWKLS